MAALQAFQITVGSVRDSKRSLWVDDYFAVHRTRIGLAHIAVSERNVNDARGGFRPHRTENQFWAERTCYTHTEENEWLLRWLSLAGCRVRTSNARERNRKNKQQNIRLCGVAEPAQLFCIPKTVHTIQFNMVRSPRRIAFCLCYLTWTTSLDCEANTPNGRSTFAAAHSGNVRSKRSSDQQEQRREQAKNRRRKKSSTQSPQWTGERSNFREVRCQMKREQKNWNEKYASDAMERTEIDNRFDCNISIKTIYKMDWLVEVERAQ